jgi:prophage regulatory protein
MQRQFERQFWRPDRVEAETGLSTSALYEEMAAGRFPKNFTLTARAVAWLSDEVEEWKRDRLIAAGKLSAAPHEPNPRKKQNPSFA